MPPVKDITGQRFGRLTVVAFEGRSKQGQALWQCECDCGGRAIVRGSNLQSGHTQSCGCLQREMVPGLYGSQGSHGAHGMSKTKAYRTWGAMIQRCYNEKSPYWQRYGGRGIQICPQWRESFECFHQDMGDPPSPQHSIDRIDNNGDYSPQNCRWATQRQQMQNTRRNRLLTFAGETKCLSVWAEELGVNSATLTGRLDTGWTVEEALSKPVFKNISKE